MYIDYSQAVIQISMTPAEAVSPRLDIMARLHDFSLVFLSPHTALTYTLRHSVVQNPAIQLACTIVLQVDSTKYFFYSDRCHAFSDLQLQHH